MITGTAFVDLSAAYDTVNHRLLIQKLYNTMLDSQLCRGIQNLLSDRRFFVELNNERSRWRIQKNGLPQGSVLSPTLFNIYTNDQPILDGTRSFIYADDMCVTAQYPTFQEVKQQIEVALGELTHYYRSNSLRANPDKTQVTAFHLRNRKAIRSLQVSWNGVDLENTDTPKYLGVTLDRTLSYKTHIHNTKMKVSTRNNLLKKLANSWWGTNARTIRTTALALCYSTAAPVWERSAYAHLLNPELNQACRAITGCLKPTNVENLYLLAGIAPPEIRRSVCARVEKNKQVERDPLPVWEHSSKKTSKVEKWYYAHLLNPELNQACRAIAGCLKPTNVDNLYLLAEIAPPEIRRSVCARVEKHKQVERDPLPVWAHSSKKTSKVEKKLP